MLLLASLFFHSVVVFAWILDWNPSFMFVFILWCIQVCHRSNVYRFVNANSFIIFMKFVSIERHNTKDNKNQKKERILWSECNITFSNIIFNVFFQSNAVAVSNWIFDMIYLFEAIFFANDLTILLNKVKWKAKVFPSSLKQWWNK